MAIDKLVSYKIESVNERGEKDVNGAYWRLYKWLEEKEGVFWADGMVYEVGKSYHAGASFDELKRGKGIDVAPFDWVLYDFLRNHRIFSEKVIAECLVPKNSAIYIPKLYILKNGKANRRAKTTDIILSKKLSIPEIEDRILASKNPKAIYLFAKEVEGANIERLENAIIDAWKPSWIYKFARDVKGANVERLEECIMAFENPFWLYKFASVVGAIWLDCKIRL
jgi:hypothetical protein